MPHIFGGYSVMILQLLLPMLLLLQAWTVEARCNRPDDLANGSVLLRRNFVRFRCNYNYVLLGRLSFSCGRDGRISGERPFCARSGCVQPPNPDNGEITIQRDLQAFLICKENFVVAGSAFANCNGNSWDRLLGECRPANHTLGHACDFESADLCGWTTQMTMLQPWRRVSTVAHFHSYRTGPRHDHTLQNDYGGHYMLMESNIMAYGEHHFLSPIYDRALSLKTACCFRFHYFMYGADVGTLAVSVKPIQLRLDQMWVNQQLYLKFNISGNQGNQWLEHTISIDEMSSDFQVVFTATGANAHFGDIAIDDVRLITGKECGGFGITTTTEEPIRETGEPVIWDEMSCKYRCNKTAPTDDIFMQEHLIKACGCDEQCVDLGNCCSDYISICLDRDDDTTTASSTTTTTTTTTTVALPTTRKTTTTTTTTRKPTTTTTTTRKPTTTTTTKKPTTTTTTRKVVITTTTALLPTTRSTTTPRTTKATKPTTTTTKASATTTRKTTTASTQATALPRDRAAPVTPPHRNDITWPVNPEDIDGETPSSSNPVRFMWYFMLAIIVIIVVGSLLYRWKRPQGSTIEKAVSFQKNLAKLKNSLPGRNRGDTESRSNSPLVADTLDNDGHYAPVEEMGVDIRYMTEL